MRDRLQNSVRKTITTPILLMVVALSCTKPEEERTPIVPAPTPAPSGPSGVIQTFTVNDTLVAFNTGTIAKWLVNGTNNLTEVRFNNVKVSTYGALETGPIQGTATFTLEVNSGKKAVLSVRAADTLTSLLWSKGKSARVIKMEMKVIPPGETTERWVDTTKIVSARTLDQRLFFGLTNSVTSVQGTNNTNVSQGNAGKFTVNLVNLTYTWQNVEYKLELKDDTNLIVTYDTPQLIGPKIRTRNTYLIE